MLLPAVLLQATYADYIGRDDSGAIAAFLDDDSTSILQASLAAPKQTPTAVSPLQQCTLMSAA